MGKLHCPVLHLAYLQYIVDEGQQVIGGNHHFLMIGLNQLRIAEMAFVDLQQSHDAVDGGADIVGHIGEEQALGLVGGLRLFCQRFSFPLLSGWRAEPVSFACELCPSGR